MKSIRPGGRRPPGKRIAAWSAASLLAGGVLAGASALGAGPADAATGPACPAPVINGTTAAVTCQYTGAAQYWTVPAGVTQATFTLYGAKGGAGFDPESGKGGLGAEVSGTLPVTAGTAVQVNVGQAGVTAGNRGGDATFGGGGSAGVDAGSGGGETDVRTPDSGGDYPFSDALLVAGGGGGGGDLGFDEPAGILSGGAGGAAGTAGGAGQSAVGGCGEQISAPTGGGAGTATGGGAGGVSSSYTGKPSCTVNSGGNGAAGASGTGGTGAFDGFGGGGGGGYYGGGGGGGGDYDYSETGAEASGAGGGGGSSYTGSAGATVTNGVAAPDDAPDGEVIITYSDPAPGDSTSCQATATSFISADCYDASQGTVNVTAAAGDSNPSGVDGNQVPQLANGDYLEYDNVDFGSGSTQFDARVASGAAPGTSGLVEVVLDNPGNAPVGSFAVANTGGWSTWQTIPANISTVTGVHNVYLEFWSGAPGNPPYVSLHYFDFPVQ